MCPYDLSGTRAYNKASSSSSISPVCTNKRIHFYFTRKLDEREKPRYKQLTLASTRLWPRSTIFFYTFVAWLSRRPRCKCFLMHTIVSPSPPPFFFLFRRDIFLTTRPLVENVSKAFPCTANTFNNPPFLISDFRS